MSGDEQPDLGRLRAELAEIAQRADVVERTLEVVALLDAVTAPLGIHPVIVGGMAVYFWTAREEFLTYDIDLVMEVPSELHDQLSRLGFTRARDGSQSSPRCASSRTSWPAAVSRRRATSCTRSPARRCGRSTLLDDENHLDHTRAVASSGTRTTRQERGDDGCSGADPPRQATRSGRGRVSAPHRHPRAAHRPNHVVVDAALRLESIGRPPECAFGATSYVVTSAHPSPADLCAASPRRHSTRPRLRRPCHGSAAQGQRHPRPSRSTAPSCRTATSYDPREPQRTRASVKPAK